MSTNREKLVNILQVTQQFTDVRVSRYPSFGEISRSLAEIATSLERAKLTIGIYSQFSISAQGLSKLFNTSQALLQFYQLESLEISTGQQTVCSSTVPQIASHPSLTLQANSTIGQLQTQYELSQSPSILIGREYQNLKADSRSQGTMLVALPNYRKISSVHALISPVANADANAPNWQICDLGSTNGIYINGQKISNCQILKSGDRVTLAYPSSSEKAPEFIFECELSSTSNQKDSINENDISCDIACLVIHPGQVLTVEEKKLIEAVSKSQIIALIIVIDISEISEQETREINTSLESVRSWIATNYPILAKKTDVAPVVLSPFYPQAANSSDLNLQKIADSLCQPLVGIAKNKSDSVITNRYGFELLSKITTIEDILNQQLTLVQFNVKRIEVDVLHNKSLDDLSKQIAKTFARVGEEKLELFSLIRSELTKARSDSFNGFTQNESNILFNIKLFVDELEPFVTRQGNQVCIQLQPQDGTNTHHAVVQFCKIALNSWVVEEWSRICNVYGENGLNGLLQRSYSKLNAIPSLTISNPFNQPSQLLNIQNILEGSFKEALTSTSYSDEGSSPNVMLNNVARVGIQAMSALGAATINPFSAAIQGVSAAAGLFNLVGHSLKRAELERYKEYRLEEIITNIRLRTSGYYQSLTEYLLGRLMQEIGLALEREERQFKKSLDTVNEQFVAYFEELNRCINEYRNQLFLVNQDKDILTKIKQL